jgi:serine/threonine protein kinase
MNEDERPEVDSRRPTVPRPADATRRTMASRGTPAIPGEGRFAPGTVPGGRYRIVALLGKGGMREVYRADDLKLRQPVALTGYRLPGTLREIRAARQSLALIAGAGRLLASG